MTEQKETFPGFHFFNKVEVVAGDIPKGDYSFEGDSLVHDTKQRLTHPNPTETISLTKPGIKSVTLQTDQSIKNLPEAALWGLASGMVFGPLGAVAGLLMGGWGTQLCSLVELADGRKFLCVTSEKITHGLQALAGLHE